MSSSRPPGGAGLGRLAVILAVVALLAIGAVVGAVVSSDGGTSTDRHAVRRTTATVERTDLVRFEEVDGTLGFADPEPLPNHLAGILTARAGTGAAVPVGSVLYEVDRRPVLLLRGAVPAYRALGPGVGEGDDVAQLEASLAELGHLDPGQVDQAFTDSTRAAVERLQEAAGASEDGVLELGEAVFASGPVRVLDHLVALGAPVAPGVPVLAVAADRQVVTAEVGAADAALVAVGDDAEVELPDGAVVPATVVEVAAVARSVPGPAGGPGDPVIDVTLELGDAVTTAVDRAPVTVRLAADVAEDVLAVPVPALLALAEGGYAVEVVGEGGATRLVAVDVGGFAGGLVEIRGELDPGDRVAVPVR